MATAFGLGTVVVVAALAVGSIGSGILPGPGVAPGAMTDAPSPSAPPVEDFDATHVVGKITAARVVAPGSMCWECSPPNQRDHTWEADVDWSDPRLGAKMLGTNNFDFHPGPEGKMNAMPMMEAFRLEGPDGTWTGTGPSLVEPNETNVGPQTRLLFLTGEGAYQGLSVILKATFENDPPSMADLPTYEGYIVKGELPPFPEVPVPSTQ